MLEDKFTIAFLVCVGLVALLVGGKVTYDHYLEDKVDNCVLDNLNSMRKERPLEYQYTTIKDLPAVRRACEEQVLK